MWHEWSFGGVLVSPYLVAAGFALLATLAARTLLRHTPLGRWIWHEALFDLALFIVLMGVVVALMSQS